MSPPATPLCQHDRGSCAACCGVYNFRDRSPEATHARLQRRTERVRAAWPDKERLAAARDELLALEADEILFHGVKVCPYAGYVEEGRVGCLLHPTRHPEGEDLRDLAVYPKEICRDHFCAPHDWLRPREVAFAQTATGVAYGLVVTDAGLVKALLSLLDGRLGRSVTEADLGRARDAFEELWRALLAWPHRDDDPHRFGGFYVVGDDAVERTLPSCLAGLDLEASAPLRTVLDGLGTKVGTREDAERAIVHLENILDEVVARVENAAARC